MYNQRVIDQADLPVPSTHRKHTDVLCACFHSVFALALLAAALSLLYHKMGDGEGGSERQGAASCPQKYHFLWRGGTGEADACVAVCPNNYQTKDNACFPSDEQQLEDYLAMSPLRPQWNTSILKEVWPQIIIFTFSLGVAMLALSYFAPRTLQRFIMLASALALLYALLAVFNLLPSPQPVRDTFEGLKKREKQISAAVLGLLGVSMIGWMICFHRELSWNGVMMDYGSKILPAKAGFILFVLKYYAGLAIVFAKFVLQSYVFSHSGSLLFAWTRSPSIEALPILNLLEYFWNLQFLKDTLYFSLSNLTASYYYSSEMDCCLNMRLNCTHCGSASGGSLFNLLFSIANLVLDWLCCFPCELCCSSLAGLARQDAYAYQSISGIPYCNCSRECGKIGNQTHFWTGSKSPLASLRLLLHAFTNALCLSFGAVSIKQNHIQITAWRMFVLFLVSESIVSGLIDVVTIFAESLQTFLLVDATISHENEHIYDKKSVFDGDIRQLLHNQQPLNPFSQ